MQWTNQEGPKTGESRWKVLPVPDFQLCADGAPADHLIQCNPRYDIDTVYSVSTLNY